eukprot:gene1016-568_t
MVSNPLHDSSANQQVRTFTREQRHATGKGWCAGGKGGTGFRPEKKSQLVTQEEYDRIQLTVLQDKTLHTFKPKFEGKQGVGAEHWYTIVSMHFGMWVDMSDKDLSFEKEVWSEYLDNECFNNPIDFGKYETCRRAMNDSKLYTDQYEETIRHHEMLKDKFQYAANGSDEKTDTLKLLVVARKRLDEHERLAVLAMTDGVQAVVQKLGEIRPRTNLEAVQQLVAQPQGGSGGKGVGRGVNRFHEQNKITDVPEAEGTRSNSSYDGFSYGSESVTCSSTESSSSVDQSDVVGNRVAFQTISDTIENLSCPHSEVDGRHDGTVTNDVTSRACGADCHRDNANQKDDQTEHGISLDLLSPLDTISYQKYDQDYSIYSFVDNIEMFIPMAGMRLMVRLVPDGCLCPVDNSYTRVDLNGRPVVRGYKAKSDDGCFSILPFGKSDAWKTRAVLWGFHQAIRLYPRMNAQSFSDLMLAFNSLIVIDEELIHQTVSYHATNSPFLPVHLSYKIWTLLPEHFCNRLLRRSLWEMVLHLEPARADEITDTIFELGDCHVFVCLHHQSYLEKIIAETSSRSRSRQAANAFLAAVTPAASEEQNTSICTMTNNNVDLYRKKKSKSNRLAQKLQTTGHDKVPPAEAKAQRKRQ